MNKSIIKYIFGLLLTTALFMVGCGSSSSNNPVSSGDVSSGLVNVKGNVTNLSGNGTVSFYTPAAAIMSNMNVNTSLRASSSVNEGVYTFNVDENGNYNGQIPAGDYYVIAQNADGSMKSVSAKQTFVSSVRAEEAGTTITLRKTYTISGKLSPDFNLNSYKLTVYIEDMPFVTNTDSNGEFTFTSVPATDSCKICANYSYDNYRYHIYATTPVPNDNGIVLTESEPISIDGKNVSGIVECPEYLLSHLEDESQEEGETVPSYVIVNAITKSGELYTDITFEENDFKFILPVNENEVEYWLVNSILVKDKLKDGKLIVEEDDIPTTERKKYSIKLNRPQAYDNMGVDFSKNENSFTFFKFDSNSISSYTEVFYTLEASYYMNVEAGKYLCMMRTENKTENCNGLGFALCNVSSTGDNEVSFNYNIAMYPPNVYVSDNYYPPSPPIIDNESASEELKEKIEIKTIAGYTKENSKESPFENRLDIEEKTDINLNTYEVIDLTSIEKAGVYNIYSGYQIKYDDKVILTITSDPVPYVKH